ncbi:MAG: hypothetical protein NWF12_02245, partial [Candidatus Bathyarchaeota archaeon]|nr:hypothetical protein [Candidatus Bathyarchaeota archaeon]
ALFFGCLLMLSVLAGVGLTAAKSRAIPFVGMSLAYYAVDWDGETEIRTVSVLRYDSEENRVVVRDSQDSFDVGVIDLDTRLVVELSGTWPGWPEEIYVEYWIPTDVKKGSHVKILNYDAIVIGSTQMSVDGRVVDVWHLQASGQDDGVYWQDTWYYEKKTGLWVAAAWIRWDSEGNVLATWGGHLVSTNAVLG